MWSPEPLSDKILLGTTHPMALAGCTSVTGMTSSSSSSSGILLFNSRSVTPSTGQAAVDDEEQQPLLQDIFEAAVNGHHV